MLEVVGRVATYKKIEMIKDQAIAASMIEKAPHSSTYT
jgi:hypothetical protein